MNKKQRTLYDELDLVWAYRLNNDYYPVPDYKTNQQMFRELLVKHKSQLESIILEVKS